MGFWNDDPFKKLNSDFATIHNEVSLWPRRSMAEKYGVSTSSCSHRENGRSTYKLYTGLTGITDVFEYCTKCDHKRPPTKK